MTRHETEPYAFRVLRGKWRLQLLLVLGKGPIRLSALQRALKGVSKKVLHENLHTLEEAGVVERRDFTTRMPYIEYTLTDPEGMALAAIVLALEQWRPREKVGVPVAEVESMGDE